MTFFDGGSKVDLTEVYTYGLNNSNAVEGGGLATGELSGGRIFDVYLWYI
jgi:hypothetical protein